MSPLCSDERRALLDLARRAILEAIHHERVLDFPAPAGALASLCCAFVTLHRGGRLCGCIGQVGPPEPLAATVVRCAIAAATKDPRFQPMRADELADLEIEVSVLSAFEPILPEAIEVGRHGLVVARRGQRGVLLPQVAAEHGWTGERFLQETCAKAGMELDAWKDPATSLLAFTAEVFSEAELATRRHEQAG